MIQRIDQITSTKNPPIPSQKWNFHTTPEPVRANHHNDQRFQDQIEQSHETKSNMKSKIEALENKARMEFEQLKLQSQAKSKENSDDYATLDTDDDTQYGDYNDVDLDEIVEIKQKNQCGINFLTKKSEGKCFKNIVTDFCVYLMEYYI